MEIVKFFYRILSLMVFGGKFRIEYKVKERKKKVLFVFWQICAFQTDYKAIRKQHKVINQQSLLVKNKKNENNDV